MAGDEKFYSSELNRTTWVLPCRYQNLAELGNGAYGVVCSATDTESQNGNAQVAIKKFTRPFQTDIHAKRCYREIKMLQSLCHENIIHLLDVFSPQMSVEEFEEVYAVSECMGADLNKIIKTQPLSEEHIAFLLYQILRGLKYIHSAGLIHRDLKPSNLAVNTDCDLKILDFGLARQHENEMTGYVSTRWYRAPEIMLNWQHYDAKVDVWSVGCIMAEMITGRPVFNGSDYIDQLSRIIAICGAPSQEYLTQLQSEDARTYITQMNSPPRRPFSEIFVGANDQAVDLLDKMLQLDPRDRINVADALLHPYFEQYSDPTDEPLADEPFNDPLFDKQLSVEEWKGHIWDIIVNFTPPPPVEM